ncbi:hypothetical protein KAH43_07270 [Candidatus Bipolaricaulota bacterium]|nr:hypothetical protein [Candidatus Bipolaricaulota bacterium]
MKRNGLRALGLASCVIAMVSFLGMAVDLNAIVADGDLAAEITNAAGLNLVAEYVAVYTADELADLAANGLTSGIKLAADRALFSIAGGLFWYITIDDDTLYAMAAGGDQDAADAWVFKSRAGLKKPAAVEEAILTSEVKTIDVALGRLLGGFYGPGSPVGVKEKKELLRMVVGESLGLRVAAATALTTYWIVESGLSIEQAELAIRVNSGVNPELALAHQGVLQYLYSL